MIVCHNSNGKASGGSETNEACGPTPVETCDSERVVAMEIHYGARNARVAAR